MATSTISSSPDLYKLEVELGQIPLAEYFKNLDDQRRVDVNNPEHREVFVYIFILVEQLMSKIEQLDSRFKLKISNTCGSAFDGTKVGVPDEFDFLLVMESLSEFDSNIKWNVDNPVKPSLYLNQFDKWLDLVDNTKSKHVLLSTLLHQKFSSLVDQAMEMIVLPSVLSHGGFATPRYSGVRSHRFAHMIQLVWNPDAALSLSDRMSTINLHDEVSQSKSFAITIDLTLVVSAPQSLVRSVLADVESSRLLGHHYESLIKRISDGLSEVGCTDYGIHMIPSTNVGWVLTTAALDFAIMELFSSNSNLKRCIRVLKVLRDDFLTLGEKMIFPTNRCKRSDQKNCVQDNFRSRMTEQVHMLFDLGLVNTPDVNNPYAFLKKFCQTQSSMVHPNVFQQLHEFTNPTCSASSGFIKYLSIQEVCNRGLGEREFKDAPTVDVNLVLTILDKMSSGGVPHVILTKNIIWPVTMHGYFNSRSLIADSMNTAWFKQHEQLMKVLKNAQGVLR